MIDCEHFDLEILKKAVDTLDKDTLTTILQFLCKEINCVKVFDATTIDDNAIKDCDTCMKFGKKSGCEDNFNTKHDCFGYISIKDMFNKIIFRVDIENISDFLKLEKNETIYPTFAEFSLIFDIDYIFFRTCDGGVDGVLFEVQQEKMKKIRKNIVDIIKSWNLEPFLSNDE